MDERSAHEVLCVDRGAAGAVCSQEYPAFIDSSPSESIPTYPRSLGASTTMPVEYVKSEWRLYLYFLLFLYLIMVSSLVPEYQRHGCSRNTGAIFNGSGTCLGVRFPGGRGWLTAKTNLSIGA